MLLALEITIRAAKSFGADRCGLFAAGITYFTLLSLFPLLLLALGVAGLIYNDPADQQQLVDNILENVPVDADSRGDLEEVIASVSRASGALGLLGLLGMAYSGSALFTAVRTSLNAVYKVEKSRSFIIGKLIDLGLVFLFGVLFLLSLAASFGLTFAARFADDLVGGDAARAFSLLMTVAYLLVPPLFSLLVFWLLFTLVPAKRLFWKHTMVGALVAAVLFEVLKAGFAQYVAAFGNYDATYGALGFVIILLLFVSFASQVTLLGGEFAYATANVAPRWPLPRDERETTAIFDKLNSLRRKIPGMSSPAPATPTGAPPPKNSPSPAAATESVPPSPVPAPMDRVAPDDDQPRRQRRASPLGLILSLVSLAALGALSVVAFITRGRDRQRS